MDIITKKKQSPQSDGYFKYKFLAVIFSLFFFVYLSWYAYNTQVVTVDPKDLPIIKLSHQIKFKPENPGGIEIANLDKGIYDYISGRQSSKAVVVSYSKEEPVSKQEMLGIVNKKIPQNKSQTKVKEEVKAEVIKASITEEPVKKELTKPIVEEKKITLINKVTPLPEKKIYYLRIAKLKSDKVYDQAWDIMIKKHYIALKGLKGKLYTEKNGNEKSYYIHAGPVNSKADANDICKKIIANGGGCTLRD